MLLDQDGNYWELLENLTSGYSNLFADECDTSHALASFSDGKVDQRSSILKPLLMSHMTCEVIDLEKSRAFYEEMFGLEMVQLSPKRLLARLNSVAVIDIIETNTAVREHKMHNHIGFDVAGQAIVDAAREVIVENQERFGFEVISQTEWQSWQLRFYFFGP